MATTTELEVSSRQGGRRRETPSRWRQRLGRFDVKASPYLFISPFFILFLITGLFPLLYTAYVSVSKWNLLTGRQGSAGFSNYVAVLHQPFFWKALRNTMSIFLISSIPQILVALVIAAVLNANLRARTFWRMGVLIPYVVAPVAVLMRRIV